MQISKNMSSAVHFEVISKLEKHIATTKGYWNIIVNIKHPSVKGKEKEVKETLQDPDYVHQNYTNTKIYLFYRKYRKNYFCVVVRHLNGKGFIITVYITNKIKEGKQIYGKNK